MSASADVSLRGPCRLPVTERVPGHPQRSRPHAPGHAERQTAAPRRAGAGRAGRGQAAGPPPIGRAQGRGRGAGRRRVSRLGEAEARAGRRDWRRAAAERVVAARRVRVGALTGTAGHPDCAWLLPPEPPPGAWAPTTFPRDHRPCSVGRSPSGEGSGEEPGPRRQKVRRLGGRRRRTGRRKGSDELGAAKPWGGVQGPLPHARGAQRLAPPSAAGVASPRGVSERSLVAARGELRSCGAAGRSGGRGRAEKRPNPSDPLWGGQGR